MSDKGMGTQDDARLKDLGYSPELSRVLSLFDNFSVAFSYLSPMVGIFSLFGLGLAMGGPRYIWTMPVVVGFMTLVALVFGELSSEYPLSGALYQYGKYNVGARYGWYVGWIYGFALLATVASVDSGVVGYVTALSHNLFKTNWDPSSHWTIFIITGAVILLSTILNSVGAKIMGRVASIGVYIETIGTFGVFITLWIKGFHQGFGSIFTTQHVEQGSMFGGHWLTGAALVAVLANVYIFFGFESAGDIAEETVNAGRQVPRAMRNALLYGGIASFVLVLGLLLAIPKGGFATVAAGGAGVILATLPSGIQDVFLLMIIIAFFSCGTAVQGAGARVAFGLARDGGVPFAEKVRKIHPKHKTPSNAIWVGAVVPFLFLLLVHPRQVGHARNNYGSRVLVLDVAEHRLAKLVGERPRLFQLWLDHLDGDVRHLCSWRTLRSTCSSRPQDCCAPRREEVVPNEKAPEPSGSGAFCFPVIRGRVRELRSLRRCVPRQPQLRSHAMAPGALGDASRRARMHRSWSFPGAA